MRQTRELAYCLRTCLSHESSGRLCTPTFCSPLPIEDSCERKAKHAPRINDQFVGPCGRFRLSILLTGPALATSLRTVSMGSRSGCEAVMGVHEAAGHERRLRDGAEAPRLHRT